MKKTGLFKIIMIMTLVMVFFTWLFSASYFSETKLTELGLYNVGFFDYFSIIFSSLEFDYFIQIFLLLLGVGAFYGVLNKTGKYRAWVERIANKYKGNEFIFLVVIAFIIAALTAVFDYGYNMLIFIPFIISIILAMGYDKVTAMLTTFGAMLVGTIGSILGYNTTKIIADLLSLKMENAFYFKIALFILSFIVLMIFLSNAKKTKELNTEEEKELFLGEKYSSKYSITPIIVTFAVVAFLLVLGCTSWSGTFGVEFFNNIHEKLLNFSPKLPYFHITSEGIDKGFENIAIFGKILGDAPALGNWYYAEMTIVLVIASMILGKIYKLETVEAMVDGVKKILKPAGMVLLCYIVVYLAGNQMFFPTIASWLLKLSSKLSIVMGSIVMIIGSVLHVDILYASNYVVPQIAHSVSNKELVLLLGQGIYGVTMFVAPTSALLVFGLTYLGVPYKEWLKKTWKLVLALLAVVLVVLIIVKVI